MPTASPFTLIDPAAQIAADVFVGPYCLIGPDVRLGPGCRLLSHVVLAGHTVIGCNNMFHPNAVIGGMPQDRKYHGEPTRLEIGDGNQFREGVTVNIGTELGGGVTRLGSDNLIMANCHVGHDVHIGNGSIIANNVMLGGHVVCGDHVHIMGGAGVHPFVTIGDHAYIGGVARIHHDVPPYMKIDGADLVRGLNTIGLRRAGFSEEDIEALQQACRRLFYRSKPFARTMAEFDTTNGQNPHVTRLVEFLRRRDLGIFGRYLEGQRKDA